MSRLFDNDPIGGPRRRGPPEYPKQPASFEFVRCKGERRRRKGSRPSQQYVECWLGAHSIVRTIRQG